MAGCAVRQPASVVPVFPPQFPQDFYRRALGQGDPVYSIDGRNSHVSVRVYRAGTLARLGHDHVISAGDFRGYVLLAPARSTLRADLFVPLVSLNVDEPQARHAAGLSSALTQSQIDGTRKNMLDLVLDAGKYPFLVIHAECAQPELPCTDLSARFDLHGTSRTAKVALDHPVNEGDRFTADGCFQTRQTDFGIVPLSVLNGALSVRDEIDVCFSIQADRVTPLTEENGR